MCPRNQKPGDPDGLCAQHRAAEERRKAKPKVVDAKTAPAVTTSRTVSATLTWATGQGPVFRAKYRSRDTMWERLTIRVRNGDMSHMDLDGVGRVLRKDNTPGGQREELRYARLEDLPEAVASLLLAAVAEA